MKKAIYLIMFLMFLNINSLSAQEYSQWSDEIPLNNQTINILTSTRYLFYELNKVNEEYLPIDNNQKEQCDLNDYIYSEYITSDTPIIETENREVTQEHSAFNVFRYDVKYIKISVDSAPLHGVRLKGFSVYDLTTNAPIDYTLSNFNNIVTINPNDHLIYQNGNIIFKLDETWNGEEIGITYTLHVDQAEAKYYRISFLDKDFTENFYRLVKYDKNVNITFNDFVQYPIWSIRADTFDKIIYKYRDKLFKCYNFQRQDIGYFENLEGNYFKDEMPKLFYSYKIIEDNQSLDEEQKDEEETNLEEVTLDNQEENLEPPITEENNTSEVTEDTLKEPEFVEIQKPQEYPLNIYTDSSIIKKYDTINKTSKINNDISQEKEKDTTSDKSFLINENKKPSNSLKEEIIKSNVEYKKLALFSLLSLITVAAILFLKRKILNK